MTITITDETATGDIINKILISVSSEQMKVKDLIAARVTSEVNTYNNKLPEYFKGLIQPTDAEKTLNGFKLKRKNRTIDVEQQIFVAYSSFQKNGYFVLVDNKQVEDLEQEVLVNKGTVVSFIKLTPLVGG